VLVAQSARPGLSAYQIILPPTSTVQALKAGPPDIPPSRMPPRVS